jgi:hypothetical protein
MAITQEVRDLVARIDMATNAIADRIQVLIGRIGGGISQSDAESIKADLQAEADRLTSLGADPNNPIP